MLAALAYLENEDRLCRAANDNAAPSARAKLKFRLAAERRFDSQDQIPRYVYDASRKLVHVEDKNPKDGGVAERTDYMSVAGMDIARVITGQGIYYQHTDHLGSTVATTTSSGFLTAKERYTPFGETLDNPGLLSDQGGFTGYIKDSATGLNYMQARYYDPVIGRFLSIDPVTFMDTRNPGYFNRYAYTFNDPINNIDPDGRACVPCVIWAVVYVADKAYGAYDAAQTAKGIADGSIDPVDAAVGQGASQLGGLIGGPVGRQIGKKTAKKGEGVIYRRTNPKSGGCYIGQCKSQKRFDERKKEHDRDKGEQHEYEVLEDDIHADDLDYVEDTYIRDEGLENLENKRHQMSETRRQDYEKDQ